MKPFSNATANSSLRSVPSKGQEIRLSGRNLTENEHVKLGAHHTLQLEPNRTFQLHKAAWDGLDLARIREACDPAVSADLAVVLITVRCRLPLNSLL